MKRLVSVIFLGATLVLPQAHAGLIATEAAQEQTERARVKALIERPEIAAELAQMGVPPQEAAARVDAMSDAEVRSLAGRLEAVPAGGQVSDRTLLLLVLIILLAIIIL